MHIAVCDDNIADRKQMERLMGREADKWIAAGDPLYSFSYGSASSLFDNFMQFDAVFIDMKETEGISTKDVLDKLYELGAMGLMVIMDEQENYPDLGEKVVFLPKPIQPAGLHETLVKAKENAGTHENLIELRGEEATLYVKEREIIRSEQNGHYTTVYLTEGRSIKFHGQAYTLYEEVADLHPEFVMPGSKTMINIRHVTHLSTFKAFLDDGSSFLVSGSIMKYIRKIMADLS